MSQAVTGPDSGPCRFSHKPSHAAGRSSKDSVQPGQTVKSLCGRDKGRYYLVLRHETEGFVWLADGRKRLLSNPKRKNVLHLQPIHQVAADLAKKLTVGQATDEEVRAAIRAVVGNKEEQYVES